MSETLTLRYDSEYYKKTYLEIEKFISGNKRLFSSLATMNLQVDASAFYPSLEPYYNSGKIPFIRVADVKREIDYDNCVNIPFMGSEFNTLHLCHAGDIVLTKGGRIGTAGLVKKDSYVTRDLIYIKSSLLDKEDYVSLYLYLSSNFAYKQMVRSSSMTAQPHLTITLIRDLLIYNFSKTFKLALKSIYYEHEQSGNKSRELYKKAEKLLNSILNITSVSSENHTTKTLSESFDISGRLDAEYYQLKYDDLLTLLSPHVCQTLGGENGLVSIKKSIEPGSEAYQEEGIPFARISNLSKFELSEPEIKLAEYIVPDARDLFPKKDTILFTKDGSVGIAYKMEEDRRVITSGGILHLTVKDTNKILPDYLTLILNSLVVQLQAERDAGGSIIQHWKPSEIEQVVIPVLSMQQQHELSDLVQESFALRRKSKQLLANAVKAVEMAIDKDEETAVNWLKQSYTV